MAVAGSAWREILRVALGAFVVAPLLGAAIGAAVATLAFNVQGLYEEGPWFLYPPVISAGVGAIMGFGLGLAMGVLFAWPLRNVPLLRVCIWLGTGTLYVAVPAALLPGGLALALLLSPLGCIVAGIALWAEPKGVPPATEQKRDETDPASDE